MLDFEEKVLTTDQIIRIVLVAGFVIFCCYKFGYSDRFPYLGRQRWRDRPYYREVHYLLTQAVKRQCFGSPMPEESIARLDETADLVLRALNKEYESIEVKLPAFDCGASSIDIIFVITREDVLQAVPDDEPDDD